eukprot:m.118640 g.118640  ORF g.118640 m.118640 type:complete len:528 (+) comp14282_c0_seq1:62-1645(+)
MINVRQSVSAFICILLVAAATSEEAPKPNVLFLLIDDLGRYDTQVTNPASPTPVIGKLAQEGIILDRHYVYMYCSPTRRSVMTGRFPTSINPNQASICSNYMPLEFTTLAEKLRKANYKNHFVGKAHLGFPTTDHLPINRGYDSHVGYLGGAEDYYMYLFANKTNKDFWHDDHPGYDVISDVKYSTNYYSRVATAIIMSHNTTDPLFMDLRYQGVHGPYIDPPLWEQVANTSSNNQKCGSTYACQIMESMVSVVDNGIGNVTQALKVKGMWNNTLVIFSADNGGGMGGDEPSNNYPLRGTKGEPWDGGVRVAAFVSGGFLPNALRGTVNSAFIHIADWYPTLANLAGVDPTDNAMYNGTIRPIDGIDAWPVLTGAKQDLGREWLPTTNQSLIWNSTWKLITSAPSTHWFTETDGHLVDGWPCRSRSARNISTKGVWQCMVCSDAEPCLFHILNDPEERTDVAKQNPDIVQKMQAAMVGLNFPPYVFDAMPAPDEARYTCLPPQQAHTQWWDNFVGPCCKPKQNLTLL